MSDVTNYTAGKQLSRCKAMPAKKNLQERRRYRNIAHIASANYGVGWINLGYVVDWLKEMNTMVIDEFTYNLMTERELHSKEIKGYCLSCKNLNISPLSKESEKWLTNEDKALVAEFGDKKSLRLITADSQSCFGVNVTSFATYEEMQADNFYVKVTPSKLLKPSKNAVYVGGNLLKIFNYMDEAAAMYSAPISIDFETLYNAFTGTRILCTESSREELCARSSVFEPICELVAVDESLLADLDGANVMNLLAGGEVMSEDTVQEGFARMNRTAFMLTVGYINKVDAKAGIFSKLRRGVSDKDYMYAVSGKITPEDIKKIDLYAETKVEGSGYSGRLIFSSAGFITPVEKDGSTEFRVVSFSGFEDFVKMALDMTPAAQTATKKYPFSIVTDCWRTISVQNARQFQHGFYDGNLFNDTRYTTLVGQSRAWGSPNNTSDAATRRRSLFRGNGSVLQAALVIINEARQFGDDWNAVLDRCAYLADKSDVSLGSVCFNKGGWRNRETNADMQVAYLRMLAAIEAVDEKFGFTLVVDQGKTKAELLQM
jgi:hypothetical protein